MMPGPVWILRTDGCIAWSNACFGALVGRDLDVRQPLEDLLHPDDRALVTRHWRERSATSEGPVATNARLRLATGGWSWHIIQHAPAPSTGIESASWIGTATNIDPHMALVETLKRDNEELEQDIFARLHELNRSRARLQTIFDACPDYLYVLRLAKDGAVTFEDINPAAETLFKGSRSSLVGRAVGDVPGLEGATSIEAYVRRALRGGRVDYRAEQRTGEALGKTVQIVGAPLAYSNEEEGLVLFCGRDITDQRAAEEALRQSQKMEAVGQLTGGLAHDFNNLLTGIMGSLDLLRMRVARRQYDRVDRYIEVAQEGAARAASLTHRLLAFSRRQTLDPKPLDTNRLVVGMEDLLRRTGGPEIAISFALAEGLWTVLADASQLENALLNLCINARDAMRDGGRISIETINKTLGERSSGERDLPPGDYVVLSVDDNGTGMSPEIAARVFDPFFTTKPIGSGTGLGLSMIYGFARQSGGDVEVQTRPGLGTTMRIFLPRFMGLPQDEEARTARVSTPRAETGEAILLVDDDHAVRDLAAELLGDLGYAITIATDGVEGLQRLQSNLKFDALITDVGMPGGYNGRQVAETARTLRPGIKVLFITGYAETDVLNPDHLDVGMQVLTKPFAMETLATRLRALLDLR